MPRTLLMNWNMKGGRVWAWGEGKVEVVEGKCSSCFLARKGPGGHTHSLQSSTPRGWRDVWLSERKMAHLTDTPR